jgi:hypothetical protein
MLKTGMPLRPVRDLRWAITSLRTHQFFGTPKFICDNATLQPQLHLILICTANMPVHEINLNPFKDYIISWFNNDMSYKEIAERLAILFVLTVRSDDALKYKD